MSDSLTRAYRSSISIYDAVLTQSNPLTKLYTRLFWSSADDKRITQTLLSYVPKDFAGTLLDVPVGTAVFTEKAWKKLSKAKIICLDYSQDMLAKARKRLDDCAHVSFVQGDVAQLPMADQTCDVVMSMNGFHAFPQKQKAYDEIHRVLKTGGKFIACFYVQGQNKRTDWLVRTILAPKGWFAPPFQTLAEVEAILQADYKQVNLLTNGAMVSFECIK